MPIATEIRHVLSLFIIMQSRGREAANFTLYSVRECDRLADRINWGEKWVYIYITFHLNLQQRLLSHPVLSRGNGFPGHIEKKSFIGKVETYPMAPTWKSQTSSPSLQVGTKEAFYLF